MSLTREAIVEQLQQILGDEQVLTDAQLLRERSIDNFRKLQNIFGVYTMPAPTAVAMVRSTEEVAKVLAFADAQLRDRPEAHAWLASDNLTIASGGVAEWARR